MRATTLLLALFLLLPTTALALETFPAEEMKPVDSKLKVAVGDTAPDFALTSTEGKTVRLSDYRGRNVLLSFVPASWTPVCSDQWPGYNIALELFAQFDADVIGINVDNTPTQWAWERAMGGLDFPVLSDFWPHGAVADSFGVLRSDGMSERALFLIDKQGVIRWIHVSDVNTRPDLAIIVKALEALPE